MEIYQLGDEILEANEAYSRRSASKNHSVNFQQPVHSSSAPNSQPVSLGTITEIKAAARNENRVNIFVDGEYSFSFDLAQLVDFKLKVGQKLTPEDVKKYQFESKFGKLYQRTLEWVLTRPHSVKETKDYLYRKILDASERAELSERIIARLLEKHYLDDKKFAKYYVENRFVKKGISKKRLELELLKKGVSSEIIKQVLAESGRDETSEIRKIIERKRAKYDDRKLISYLCRQGFSYDLVREMVENG